MVDALSSGGSECMLVGVQVPPLAPDERPGPKGSGLLLFVYSSKCRVTGQNVRNRPKDFRTGMAERVDEHTRLPAHGEPMKHRL